MFNNIKLLTLSEVSLESQGLSIFWKLKECLLTLGNKLICNEKTDIIYMEYNDAVDDYGM